MHYIFLNHDFLGTWTDNCAFVFSYLVIVIIYRSDIGLRLASFFARSAMKYILVTGGVISGIGKGAIASSLGTILKAGGVRVTSIKIDPYINIDAGTFSPYEHGNGNCLINYYILHILVLLYMSMSYCRTVVSLNGGII